MRGDHLLEETITIKKNVPHLLMWFCRGSEECRDSLPIPSGESLNYFQTLKDQCNLLKRTDTPVYLLYKGDWLNDRQKQQMKLLHNRDEFSNLFVLDYDDFTKKCEEESADNDLAILHDFKIKLNNSFEKFKSQKDANHMGDGSIAHIVDAARILLLYRPDVLKKMALEQFPENELLKNSPDGLIYRDFDVIPKQELEDVVLPKKSQGFVFSTNYDPEKQIQSQDLNENQKEFLRNYNLFKMSAVHIRLDFAKKTFFYGIKNPKENGYELTQKEEDDYNEFVKQCQLQSISVNNILAGSFDLNLENSLIQVDRSRHSIFNLSLRRFNQIKGEGRERYMNCMYDICVESARYICQDYSELKDTSGKHLFHINQLNNGTNTTEYYPLILESLALGNCQYQVGSDSTWDKGKQKVTYHERLSPCNSLSRTDGKQLASDFQKTH